MKVCPEFADNPVPQRLVQLGQDGAGRHSQAPVPAPRDGEPRLCECAGTGRADRSRRPRSPPRSLAESPARSRSSPLAKIIKYVLEIIIGQIISQ